MTATPDEALKLQRRLPDGSLRIVARGVKEDVGSSDGDLTPKTTRLGSTGLAQRNPRSEFFSPTKYSDLPKKGPALPRTLGY
jgi:hypothetical protein